MKEKKNWKLINFCEVDSYATKSYCAIHKVDEKLNLGDVTKIDEKKLNSFNMIVGGSPCQDFSVAGKQKGSVWKCKECEHEYNPLTVHHLKRDRCPECNCKELDKSRSSLLVEWLRVIRANKPNFGIYENVKNIVGKKFRETTFKLFEEELREYGYNTYWKVLNAKDYGVPQNRERIYLILIKKELDNGEFKYPEPFDNGIRLKDILEDEVEDKYYISEDKLSRFLTNLNTKNTLMYDVCQVKREGRAREYNKYAPTLPARDYKDPRLINDNVVKQIGQISECKGNWSNPQVGRIYSPNGCCPTLNTCSGGSHEPKIICGVGKSYNNPKIIEKANCITSREDRGISNHQAEGTAIIEKVGNINPSGKGMNGNEFSDNRLSPTLTTNKGEGQKVLVKQATKKGYIECEIGGVADLSYPAIFLNSSSSSFRGWISPTITATETSVCKIESEVRIRKLTPKECFRLMSFPDWAYEATKSVGISNTQLYKQAGNSIVADVIYYILVELYRVMPYLFEGLKLGSYFSGIGAFELALNRLFKSINSENFTRPQVD